MGTMAPVAQNEPLPVVMAVAMAEPLPVAMAQPMVMNRGEVELPNTAAGQRRGLRRRAPANEPNLDDQMAKAHSGCYIHEYCIYGTCILIRTSEQPMRVYSFGCCLCLVTLPLPLCEYAESIDGKSQFVSESHGYLRQQEFWFLDSHTLVNYGHELDDCTGLKEEGARMTMCPYPPCLHTC